MDIPIDPQNKSVKRDSIIGDGTKISDSTFLQRSVLGDNVTVGKNVRIEDSFIYSNTKIEDNVVISHSIIGPKCVIKSKSKFKHQNQKNSKKEDKLGNKAYRLRISAEDEEEVGVKDLTRKMSRLYIDTCNHPKSESESEGFSDSDDDALSYTQSPVPDDTKLFFSEVNFNVIKAILTMSLREPIGPQYFSYLSRLLSYFAPVLKNYIRI
ncbi:hypothetical protein NQ317_012456 [Molorchus minor]|uniref:EIF2B subunit epsilon/gamma LbH domain-containing protein n=1 Tax=Molorchus minor TaxID=1323400 RepID=A0ABQ9JA53_9CUCU|nr:hypothetical protein NQ317_012456 [Molorchus minor]